jgi:DNA invertase Pin-like site-specific DNA recombinase
VAAMPTVTVIQPKMADNEQQLLRVAAYCRVSSSSDDQLNSYNSQLTYYSHKFEGSETETLIDIYADEGITGTSEEKRTEFLRLIDDCRKGKIDRIYTKSISRFARNTRDCLKNIRELKSLGITIMFEKENIDTANITDELMLTVMGGLAQEESTSISQNLKWSFRRRCKAGNIKAWSAPFGYDIENGQLVINTREALIIKEIYEMFLSGIGYQKIAEYCQANYSEYKASFSYYGIRYILSNERYIGDSLYQKNITSTALPFRKTPNNQKDKYLLTATHSPIITNDVFEIAQQIIASRKHQLKQRDTDFKPNIICGSCGSRYKFKECKNEPFWVCRKHDATAANCISKRIRETSIKRSFIKLFNKLYNNIQHLLVPLHDSLQYLETTETTGNQNIIELRSNILQLKEQLRVIATLRTKGFINEVKYKEQINDLTAKINKLNKDIRLLSQSDDTILKDTEMLIDYFKKREHIMVEFEPQAFEFLIDKIVVNSNELEFHIIKLVFAEKI